MFAIVRFPENEIEVVPLRWIAGNKCLWPQQLMGVALRNAIKKCYRPEPSWGYHIISLLKKFSKYYKNEKKYKYIYTLGPYVTFQQGQHF